MTPESREILRKWLDRGADWLTPADMASGVAIQHRTLQGSEIVTTRIDPEKYFQSINVAADEIRRTCGIEEKT